MNLFSLGLPAYPKKTVPMPTSLSPVNKISDCSKSEFKSFDEDLNALVINRLKQEELIRTTTIY